MPKTVQPIQITEDTARLAMRQASQTRVTRTGEEIKKIFEKYGTSLEASMMITKDGVTPLITIVIDESKTPPPIAPIAPANIIAKSKRKRK